MLFIHALDAIFELTAVVMRLSAGLMVTISPILNLWEAIGSSTSPDDGVTDWTCTAPWEIWKNQVAALVQLKPGSFSSVRDVRIHVVGWTVIGDNRVGRSQRLWKYFRMSVRHDFIRRLEQDLAECRSGLELLESGRMQNRERRDGGAGVDTTQRELDWHKKTIGMYEGLVRKLRAEHGGGDL